MARTDVHSTRYYTTKCEHCGWIGCSSDTNLSGTHFHTDDDMVCPKCDRIMLGDEYDWHLDPSMPLDVPAHIKGRLKRNSRSHVDRARKINKALAAANAKLPADKHKSLLEIEKFDIIDVYEEHNWTCFYCFRRVDIYRRGLHPDSCVVGHKVALSLGGSHTRDNVGPAHYRCNASHARAIEVPAAAKTERLRKKHLGVDRRGNQVDPKPKTKMKGASQWPKGKKRWPSRTIQSRPFSTKR